MLLLPPHGLTRPGAGGRAPTPPWQRSNNESYSSPGMAPGVGMGMLKMLKMRKMLKMPKMLKMLKNQWGRA